VNRRHFFQTLASQLGTVAALSAASGCASSRRASERSEHGTVLNGIGVLERENFVPLRKLRLGLITNHTGHDRQRRATIDLLKNAPEVKLVALFSPEHGIRGEVDQKIGDSVDGKTGLPVFSLYGERRTPAPEQLRNLDALVFDIQDIGCRFIPILRRWGCVLRPPPRRG
jgi:uncharacterized protein YbbC (DUF1343 family)